MPANRLTQRRVGTLEQAEVYGYRPEGSSPCTGIKRYRWPGREWFLTAIVKVVLRRLRSRACFS